MDSVELWRRIIEMEGQSFRTAGRGSRPGVEFYYDISRTGGSGGRHYGGESVPGFGNELWIIKDGVRKEKSISRSTVELAYTKATEMGGNVAGPRALSIPGAHSYLYPILVKLGVIRKSPLPMYRVLCLNGMVEVVLLKILFFAVFVIEVCLSHARGDVSGNQSKWLSSMTGVKEGLLRRLAHVILFAALAITAGVGFGWYGVGAVFVWALLDEVTKIPNPGRHFSANNGVKSTPSRPNRHGLT